MYVLLLHYLSWYAFALNFYLVSVHMVFQARESWEKETREMHFKRLQHLLEKSNIYSKFLLTKMEQQQQEVGFYVVFGGWGWGGIAQDILMD